MAEAITNAKFGDLWQAYSAGTQPTGEVHPNALAVLEEIGIYHEGNSKNVTSLQGMKFDLVVTVCDDAAENCPVWLGEGDRLHYSFPDPAKATGSEAEILDVFRKVRDDIDKMIATLVE
jgi:arsenate reductase